ncbi:hypothetical protein BABINDRAFT_159795 [Babjeviella inositovora NRRL Y-12698]|uniref:DNA repair protein RAD5 n=1 Tax=Babjeviella inositovora NRRL Y-12698 TaxID=984486 RepID=A0A1E3QV81_9ASCO|nr:uncharacterized protein BABINDRAFT_159795 [Babjeviella inositovora NRRL Y-12698]ODQ81514.1 hypothetical protein BABINDRAFT_159795 [Babjeviella inositovora NRRL Y-12698]
MSNRRFFVLEEESLELEPEVIENAFESQFQGHLSGDAAADTISEWQKRLAAFLPVTRSQVEVLHTKYSSLLSEDAFATVVNELLDRTVQPPTKASSHAKATETRSLENTVNDTCFRITPQSSYSAPPSVKEIIVLDDLEDEAPTTHVKRPLAGGVDKYPKKQRESGWKRFIGSFQVRAWAVRPTVRPLKFRQTMRMKRLIPKSLKKTGDRFGSTAVIRLEDIETHREIGRLPEDVTKMLSPLLDLAVLELDCRVILCESRLSTGDSFGVQIDCYFSHHAFEEIGAAGTLNPFKKRDESKFALEPESEVALKLRQKSMVKLFAKLNVRALGNSQPSVVDDTLGDEAESEKADELNVNQLKELYRSSQQAEMLENLPETVPPNTFQLELRPYQKQGLTWLLYREKETKGLKAVEELEAEPWNQTQQVSQHLTQDEIEEIVEEEGMINPLWKEYNWPEDTSFANEAATVAIDRASSSSSSFYANMYSGELSLEKPVIRQVTKGGILADEMGLGKTISTLALIHSAYFDKLYDARRAAREHYAYKTTLIVVPMSLLSQWQREFETSNTHLKHKCYVYYGSDGNLGDLTSYLCDDGAPIVVLTTYGTIMNEWAKNSRRGPEGGKLSGIKSGAKAANSFAKSSNTSGNGLFSVKFFRIVLDEGHTIRNRTTKTTKAVYDLTASRKWLITGTPIINRLDDLFSLVKFLELEPWCNVSYWKSFITVPFENKNVSQALDIVKAILDPIIIRRTKVMKQKNGRALVELPEKEVTIEYVKFEEEERTMYDWFLKKAENSFQEGLKSGELLKRYTTILVHILRLRQLCCHPLLVGTAGDELEEISVNPIELSEFQPPTHGALSEQEVEATVAGFSTLDLSNTECSICTNSPVSLHETCVTPCGHTYCLECLLCHIDFQVQRGNDAQCPMCRAAISKKALFRVRRNRLMNEFYLYDSKIISSKIKALLSHLRALKDRQLGEQVIVFSQFSTYLDLIETALAYESDDYLVYKFDGRLSMQERQSILEKFQSKQSTGRITVLLLSLKAGGVGLNLTNASRGFMMDPWWSRSIEDQAIDRLHRIGQLRNVKVVRFIMEGSIEVKMLKIQERKKQLGEIVSAQEEERRQRRIEEIQLLFEEE